MKQAYGSLWRSILRLPVLLLLSPAPMLLGCDPVAVDIPPGARPVDAGESGRGGASGGGTGGRGSPGTGTGGSAGIAGAAGGGYPPGTGGAMGTAGAGGSAPAADAGRPTPPRDGGGPADARPALEGGSVPSGGLDERCTVPGTFQDRSMGNEGGRVFKASIGDPVAVMQVHSRAICRILYRKPEEVKPVSRTGLAIEPNEIIAFAAGGNITFSTDYIASFSKGKSQAAIDAELNGVLVHEGTHVWQYTNGGGALVEAMADYVRYKAGFYTLSRRRPGGNWDQPYTVGGFFIAWMEEKYDPDLGYKINMGMKDRGFSYPAFIQRTLGKPIDALWAEYQAAIR